MKPLAVAALLLFSCFQKQRPTAPPTIPPEPKTVAVGADQMAEYLPILAGKRVALVVNQTSRVGTTHLIDSLKSLKINVLKIFSPEHGFRGEAGAGDQIDDGRDAKSGIAIVSIYGKKKKPAAADLADVDIVVFDIQDVGARFFTYISTLKMVMSACAENQKPLVVLDRPNPNGNYVDGPVLEPEFRSFVGELAIPIVHGCSVGELAGMMNREGWLDGGLRCELTVVPCLGWSHSMPYELPVRPSPNLPNQRAVMLYPSLCLFEGTNVSVGRGTEAPFQVLGNPDISSDFCFTPQPCEAAREPLFSGKKCCGIDFNSLNVNDLFQKRRLDLGWLFQFQKELGGRGGLFLKNKFFDKLAGNSTLREQILAGKSEAEIRESWQPELVKFRKMRAKYLLYEDF